MSETAMKSPPSDWLCVLVDNAAKFTCKLYHAASYAIRGTMVWQIKYTFLGLNTYNWSILTSTVIVNYYGCFRNSYPNLEKVFRKSDHTTNFCSQKKKAF